MGAQNNRPGPSEGIYFHGAGLGLEEVIPSCAPSEASVVEPHPGG
ncbi:hypothetical protein WMF26_33025 [Sorangium sp. So ce185]